MYLNDRFQSLEPLTKVLKNDQEAYLQLLLSFCTSNTFNRIENCPTYPLNINTQDLEERKNILNDIILEDPFKIAAILSVLYEYSIKREYRQITGQYFTPQWIANRAIDHLMLKTHDIILDAGSGTGIFPINILSFLNKKNEDTTCYGYIGVENDPLLALSTAVSLEIINAPPQWKVYYANYLLINSNDLQKIIEKMNLLNNEINAIISNPPFVKFQRLKGDSKYILKDTLNVSSYSGLHSYFLAQSSKLLSKGIMVYVVPIEMNGTNYGQKILNTLRNKFNIKNEIIYHDNNNWKVISAHKLTLQNFNVLNKIWNLMIFDTNVDDNKNMLQKKRILKRPKLHKISLSSFATIHRGISTGANDFFVLTDTALINIGVPKNSKYIRKIVPTKIKKNNLSYILDNRKWNKFRNENKPCWLLTIPNDIKLELLPYEIKQYIKKGEKLGIHLRPTCKKRTPWYSVPLNKIPDLFFTYISRGYPNFIYNKAKIHILTNFLGFYLKKTAHSSKPNLLKVTKLLNTELRNWIDEDFPGRKYAGGFVKFEPSDLTSLPIDENALKKLLIYPSLDIHFKS